ncbi:MAG: efflux RND transporter periplasmic adaptor subunit [Proteiniphilum sp.]
MKTKRFHILLLLILLVSFSCKRESGKPEQSNLQKKTLVEIYQVTSSGMITSIDITGTIQANIVTDVKSPADGIIERLMARENQYVQKDKLIAEINPTDRVSLISSGIERVEELTQKVKTADQLSDDYQTYLSELENAKSELAYAQNMYKTIPVVCPMNGMITKRWLDKGSQVSAKEIIITITDMTSLVIKAEVNEKYFEALKQGMKIPVVLNAYPNDSITGVISLVYPQVDPVSRTVQFDMRILNFSKPLLPGMMASIQIPISVIDDALSVPEYAVLTSPDNSNFVFMVDADSIAHRQIIQTGITSGNTIQIISGLKRDDKIVVSGHEMLKDGAMVLIAGKAKGVKE